MQIEVENSELILLRDAKIAFNPCIHKSAKTLLYIKYSFKGLEKVLIYDYSKV